MDTEETLRRVRERTGAVRIDSEIKRILRAEAKRTTREWQAIQASVQLIALVAALLFWWYTRRHSEKDV